nr:MAG TPA: hypothetical protein [Caudoviricetes sp.]
MIRLNRRGRDLPSSAQGGHSLRTPHRAFRLFTFKHSFSLYLVYVLIHNTEYGIIISIIRDRR